MKVKSVFYFLKINIFAIKHFQEREGPSRNLLRALLNSRRFVVSSTLEGLVSGAGVALGLQQVVAEVHDHEPGEGVEQPAADHAQLVVVQPQLPRPRE